MSGDAAPSRKCIIRRRQITGCSVRAADIGHGCVNLRSGYALAVQPATRNGPNPAAGGYLHSTNRSRNIPMKKLIAALIAGSFAFAGAAFAADAKKEEKKPTAEECKKDPKMKGCEQPAKK
jgi:hypothetical protein